MQSVLTIGIDLPQRRWPAKTRPARRFFPTTARYLTHRRELGHSANCVVEATSGALHELAAKATNSWFWGQT
jgi:hypothetical protein